jgi:HlyD family secretion protein
MKQTIFPKEIIRFSLESHYSRFSNHKPIIYLLLVVFVVTVCALLPLIKVDITVQSRGIIRSLAEPTVVMTPVTGMVREIRIRENMKVSKGDTLLILSPEKIDDQSRIVDEKIATYKQYLRDLERLTSGSLLKPESELLASSLNEYSQKLKEYQLRIEMCSKDFERTKTLFEKSVIAAAEYEKKELELNQLIRERDFYINQKKAAWHQQIFQYKTELQSLTDSREQLSFEKRFYLVIAPTNGYITNFNGTQTGSFIFPNQSIATITPSENIVVECYVDPADIGYLRQGNSATFQVDAYNYNQWGLANGEIIDISNQPYQENGKVYFKLKCKLHEEYLALKSGYKGELKNGFTLTSRFVVTRRSLYDLLFDKADNWLNPKIVTK